MKIDKKSSFLPVGGLPNPFYVTRHKGYSGRVHLCSKVIQRKRLGDKKEND